MFNHSRGVVVVALLWEWNDDGDDDGTVLSCDCVMYLGPGSNVVQAGVFFHAF